MNVFDIIGPIMVGPSSSHTAGAVRIGKMARMVLNEEPVKALVQLHGSFAKTYRGHGTDRAIAAGIMGFEVDDDRIVNSLNIAKERNLDIEFEETDLGSVHPNTAKIVISSASNKTVSVTGSSIGGGNIIIVNINGINVEFTGQYYTIIITHKDKPGIIAHVTDVLAKGRINIAFMKVYRTLKGGDAMMVIEADHVVDMRTMEMLNNLDSVKSATLIKAM